MSNIILYVYNKKGTSKDGKKTWTKSTTTMNLLEAGNEEKGIQHFNVDVVFKDKEERAKVEKLKGRIKITVSDTDISAPSKYRVTQEQKEDGTMKNKYPCVFIDHFIEAVECPKPIPQSAFAVDDVPSIDDEELKEDLKF